MVDSVAETGAVLTACETLSVMNRATTAFVALGLIWGSNFLFMKWASETITAGQITLLRVLFGFLPVLAYAAIRGRSTDTNCGTRTTFW
jgi:drug/metabolite transporter (DMT)-like permease